MKKEKRAGVPEREQLLVSRRDLLAAALVTIAVATRSASYGDECPPRGGGPTSTYEYAYAYTYE